MIAHQLNGDIPEALEVYDALVGISQNDGLTGSQRALTNLHVIKMCMEAGRYEEALQRLGRGLHMKELNLFGETSYLQGAIYRFACLTCAHMQPKYLRDLDGPTRRKHRAASCWSRIRTT